MSENGYISLETRFQKRMADLSSSGTPKPMLKATEGIFSGWRLMDQKTEHLSLRLPPNRSAVSFTGPREGVGNISALFCWEKLFPESFPQKIISFH